MLNILKNRLRKVVAQVMCVTSLARLARAAFEEPTDSEGVRRQIAITRENVKQMIAIETQMATLVMSGALSILERRRNIFDSMLESLDRLDSDVPRRTRTTAPVERHVAASSP